jgi:transketolase
MSNAESPSAALVRAEREVSRERVHRLEEAARQIRIDILRMTYMAGPERKAHPGGALSAADIVAALYFDIMRIDPARPKWPDRDRFILSKGHACPVLYAALACRGYFGKDAYRSLRRVDGMLQGHPDMKNTPGVDMTTGSLGHGLSAGMGMALAARIDHKDYRVFVLLGDGECQEGLVWEAAMAAHHYRLDNLVAIVDANGLQSCDWVEATIALNPFAPKWTAFGWRVMEINGHRMEEVVSALDCTVRSEGRPTVIVAKTVKGKGVSFMENDNSWHQRAPDRKQYEQALAELGGKGEM